MKVINPKIHGILDYIVVVFLWSSIFFVPFTSWVRAFTLSLGLIHLLLTLLTDFPAGAFKILPLRIHGFVELFVSFVLIVSPWLLDLQAVDRTFYAGFGIAVFVTWVLTDYEKQQ